MQINEKVDGMGWLMPNSNYYEYIFVKFMYLQGKGEEEEELMDKMGLI